MNIFRKYIPAVAVVTCLMLSGAPAAFAEPGDGGFGSASGGLGTGSGGAPIESVGTGSGGAKPEPIGTGSPTYDKPVSIPEVTAEKPTKPADGATPDEIKAYESAKAEYDRQVSARENAKGLEYARQQAKKARDEAAKGRDNSPSICSTDRQSPNYCPVAGDEQ